ncbi:MAG: class II fructose-1,6-bisphosphate aldolase [Actinobacteria bacterium]|nr:class II fructose-1,6-bisphosphate aldolase [Actinomycetota bacterium]
MKQARDGGYAVGAFNTNNLEITQAIFRAAKEEKSPIILAISPSAMKYAGARNLVAMARIASEETGVPVSVHLDHGTELEHLVIAIQAGFSSIMYDGSKYPYEENVRLTQEAVKLGHAAGVSVEGELGRLVGTEEEITVSEREASMTNPDQALDYVERTGIDALAVSIGNAHGWYKGKPLLDFERLETIKNNVGDKTLLVLHGASGVPDEDIRMAVSLGITKINIDTETRDAFKRGVAEFIQENPDVIDPRKILKPAIEEMYKVVSGKIRLFGSSGKASESIAYVTGGVA